MTLRPIPHTSLRVSPLCLGTMTFGTPVAEADAIRIVHRALDQGINFFDTADIYEGYARVLGSPGGVAETILGKALAGRRDRAVVTTKVGNPVGAGPDDTGLGRRHIQHQIDASLRRLQMDCIDLYELHKPDPQTPLEESIGALVEAIRAGKIRHWGFSNFDAPAIRQMIAVCDAHGWPRPVVSQPKYNWLDRELEAAHLPACREFAIAVTPYQPLQAGLLTGRYRRGAPAPAGTRAAEHARWLPEISPEMFDRIEAFEREAAGAGRSPLSHAMKWVLERPGVTSIVVGCKSVGQLDTLLYEARE
ncbi:MAG: aldo/keto reductase [Planctomycetota bacterium]|nr:aldo/keto reductase [Planctomycetota bacterium]